MSGALIDFPSKAEPTAPKRARGARVQRPRYSPSAAAVEKGELQQDLVNVQADLERLSRTLGDITLRMIRLRVE